MERSLFAQRLDEAAARARDFARNYIIEELPDELRFRVRLNSSCDAHLRGDERVFPGDSAPEVAARLVQVTAAQLVETLWRDGCSPEWVDLSVIGKVEGATLIEVTSCGRFVADDGFLYHQQEGYPPFHVVGPTLPVGWEEGQKFSLHHRTEATCLAEIDTLAEHADKVWFLTLFGDASTDEALARIPPLPSVEIIELKASPIRGPGLLHLARHPSLRVFRVYLLDDTDFFLPELPIMRTMATVLLANLPESSWGFEQVEAAWPELEWLDVIGHGALQLDGKCPRRLQRLAITARKLRGALRLPRRIGNLSLHLSDTGDAAMRELLNPVCDLGGLSLRGTPVGADLVEELVRRCRPEYLDVVGTRVGEAEVADLVARHSSLRRTLPNPS